MSEILRGRGLDYEAHQGWLDIRGGNEDLDAIPTWSQGDIEELTGDGISKLSSLSDELNLRIQYLRSSQLLGDRISPDLNLDVSLPIVPRRNRNHLGRKDRLLLTSLPCG